MNTSEIIDIHSKAPYPSCALSNFAGYEFFVDGVRCNSMEGFLQSLKFRSPGKQRKICLLKGSQAKKSTAHSFAQLRWRLTRKLYWQGRKISRFSAEYQLLLDKAYAALSENGEFMRALKSTEGKGLIHSIGKTDCRKTVLTQEEFIRRLLELRG